MDKWLEQGGGGSIKNKDDLKRYQVAQVKSGYESPLFKTFFKLWELPKPVSKAVGLEGGESPNKKVAGMRESEVDVGKMASGASPEGKKQRATRLAQEKIASERRGEDEEIKVYRIENFEAQLHCEKRLGLSREDGPAAATKFNPNNGRDFGQFYEGDSYIVEYAWYDPRKNGKLSLPNFQHFCRFVRAPLIALYFP